MFYAHEIREILIPAVKACPSITSEMSFAWIAVDLRSDSIKVEPSDDAFNELKLPFSVPIGVLNAATTTTSSFSYFAIETAFICQESKNSVHKNRICFCICTFENSTFDLGFS